MKWLFKDLCGNSFFFVVAEDQAPPSSCLVHKLIFQFIESRGSWQKKCPTLHCLPQVTFQGNLEDSEKKSNYYFLQQRK